jgi:hypothetical protein
MDTVAHRVYIISENLSANILEFKYHYGVDSPEQTRDRITRGLRRLRVCHYQHGFGQDVHRKETGQIQDHAIQNVHAEKRKKST